MGLPPLLIQVWAEILRNDEPAAVVRARYDQVRAAWRRVVESYKAAGLIAEDADAMARVIIPLAQKFAAQRAVFGDLSGETLQDALRALMSMRDPRRRVWRIKLG